MPRDIKGKPVKGDESMSAAGAPMAEMGSKDGPNYGMRVHVDHEGLKKMGIDELPQVGHTVEVRAKAQVAGVHMDEDEKGNQKRRLELQITHMGIHHKPDGMKSQDQGGSSKTPEAGKVTEKGGAKPGKTAKEPSYGRKRH